jgi:hypothetical protein
MCMKEPTKQRGKKNSYQIAVSRAPHWKDRPTFHPRTHN